MLKANFFFNFADINSPNNKFSENGNQACSCLSFALLL